MKELRQQLKALRATKKTLAYPAELLEISKKIWAVEAQIEELK